MFILEVSLAIVVLLIGLSALHSIAPEYIHKIMTAWKMNRKLYSFTVNLGDGVNHLKEGGRAKLKLWQDTPNVHVVILYEQN